MAQKGYDVTAFDLTENGIKKTIALAKNRGVKINAYVDDINTFETDKQFDIIYSTGTVQYLFEENKTGFFEKLEKIIKPNGIVSVKNDLITTSVKKGSQETAKKNLINK